MDGKRLVCTVVFTADVLGTKPADKDVFQSYIASKAPDKDHAKEELERAEKVEEMGTTVFHRAADGRPGIDAYMVKGFFKDACGSLRRVPGTISKDLKAYKSVIDSLIFVEPDFIAIDLPTGATVGVCSRPIRVETMQGPRVSVVRSESLPAGSSFQAVINLLRPDLEEAVREWLGYGALRGFCQWRNSGKGRFTYELTNAEG